MLGQRVRDEAATSVKMMSAEDETDEQLALQRGADSFTLLYRRYLRPVYSYLYARLGNRQEAEDVTSLAFERAWSSLSTYFPTHEGSFRGWLFTIASRALSDHYRSRKSYTFVPVTLAYTLPDTAQGPEEKALASEQLQGVLRVMSGLRPEQQEVMALRFMAELRYSEIAEIVGKSEASVKMSAYRALEEIRRMIEAEG